MNHITEWLPENLEELATEPSVDERQRRVIDSRWVSGRLPAVLRQGKRPDLEARVKAKKLLEAIAAWRWGGGNMLLLGPSEIGKTTAAAILFRRLLGLGVARGGTDWQRATKLEWFSAETIAQARAGHPLGRGEAPELTEASRCRLLFLDDLGWERDPSAVSAVLAARYNAGLPTISTSGKTTAELEAHYGAAVLRRILESGGREPVIVDCFGGSP